MKNEHSRSTWKAACVLAVILALIAAACSSDGSAASDTTVAGSRESLATTTTTVSAGEDSGGDARVVGPADLGNGAVEPAVFQVESIGRDIIFTASLTVAVIDVGLASETATREIAALGGFVFGQRTTGDPNPTSVLTFKVFPEDFQKALTRLGNLGELRTQNISADDVTERVVDLESRINTAEASVDRLRALLEEAGDITTLAQLENQLLERETQLETLRGQLRTLQDQVALATIVVTLTEAMSAPAVQLEVSAYPGHSDAGQSCPGNFGELTVDEGSEATVCFEMTNVGDTALAELAFNDPVLGLELGDLIVVESNTDTTLEPGDRLVLAAEIVVDRNLRTQSRVSAVALDGDGQPLPGRTVADTATFFLDAVDPGGVASFSEGLVASLDFLKGLGLVLILGIGIILPFAWLVPLGWLIWRFRRRDEVAGTRPEPRKEEKEPELEPTG